MSNEKPLPRAARPPPPPSLRKLIERSEAEEYKAIEAGNEELRVSLPDSKATQKQLKESKKKRLDAIKDWNKAAEAAGEAAGKAAGIADEAAGKVADVEKIKKLAEMINIATKQIEKAGAASDGAAQADKDIETTLAELIEIHNTKFLPDNARKCESLNTRATLIINNFKQIKGWKESDQHGLIYNIYAAGLQAHINPMIYLINKKVRQCESNKRGAAMGWWLPTEGGRRTRRIKNGKRKVTRRQRGGTTDILAILRSDRKRSAALNADTTVQLAKLVKKECEGLRLWPTKCAAAKAKQKLHDNNVIARHSAWAREVAAAEARAEAKA